MSDAKKIRLWGTGGRIFVGATEIKLLSGWSAVLDVPRRGDGVNYRREWKRFKHRQWRKAKQ